MTPTSETLEARLAGEAVKAHRNLDADRATLIAKVTEGMTAEALQTSVLMLARDEGRMNALRTIEHLCPMYETADLLRAAINGTKSVLDGEAFGTLEWHKADEFKGTVDRVLDLLDKIEEEERDLTCEAGTCSLLAGYKVHLHDEARPATESVYWLAVCPEDYEALRDDVAHGSTLTLTILDTEQIR